MDIATWNVNSIRARHEKVIAWLADKRPDVLCMQELKVEDAGFPREPFEALGYQLALFGQKTYNGVGIASKFPIEDVVTGLGDDEADPQSRMIAATIQGVRVASVYVPNGQDVGTEKYAYKLAWMARLQAWLGRQDRARPLMLCGDYNVAPEDRDVHDPIVWEEQIMCSTVERAALRELVGWGLHDVFRKHHSDGGLFTWWDYRQLSFPKKKGLRINHILVTPELAERCTACVIDREARKGKNASDHAPVIATFT